jgi:predicted methyltransferase
MKKLTLALLLMITSAGTIPAFAQTHQTSYAGAARAPADAATDAMRKPQAMVRFARIKPGSKVADLLPGTGYFTRVFSVASGKKGHVYAVIPPQAAQRDPASAETLTHLNSDPKFANVTVAGNVLEAAGPGALDVVWTSRNYHDLHIDLPPQVIQQFNAAAFAALKSGGVYVVVDHAAAAGSGTTQTKELHRIDPQVVKSEVTAAGFVFEAQGNDLRNPSDDHSKSVFDPAVGGHTDQFMYRFRKP